MNEETTYGRRWWTLAVLCLCTVVIGLDNTVLNVALPTLIRDLPASASQAQWIVAAYTLLFAGLLLTMASLADRFGRKRALVAGLSIFGAGSAVAADAGSAEHLIATRAFMGIGGALIMPAGLSITTNIFPATERGRAIGIWSAGAGVSIVLGPVLGGALLARFWWGAVFLINLPVVVVAIAAALVLVPESKDPSEPALDPPGAALSTTGLAALLYAIIEVPAHGWSDRWVLASFLAAATLLALFVAWERRVAAPMLQLRLFRNPRFTAASLALTLASFALFGFLFILTQYLQFVLGYSPLRAGAALIPVAVAMAISAPGSAAVVGRFGTKLAVAAGLAITAGGLAIMTAATTDSGYGVVAATLGVAGFGMGLAFAPATDSIMGAVPRARAGVGSAMNDTTRQVGGALGVAVLGSVLSAGYHHQIAAGLRGLSPATAATARDSIGATMAVAGHVGGAAALGLAAAGRDAFTAAMTGTLWISAGIVLAGALLALLYLPSRDKIAPPREDTWSHDPADDD